MLARAWAESASASFIKMILPFLRLIPSNQKVDVSREVTTSAMMHTQFMVILEAR